MIYGIKLKKMEGWFDERYLRGFYVNKALNEKFREALASVLPITLIVCALCFLLVPMSLEALMLFLCGAVMLVIGMALFTLGVDMAMTPMGESVGAQLTKNRRIKPLIIISFIIGFIITVAEPDLQVLAHKVQAVPTLVLIVTVALGVGAFLVLALLRIVFRTPLNWLFIGFYMVVFALSAFVPNDFVAAAFDSGGVTTGPMTVPFILALGVGVFSVRSDQDSDSDSFGLVALCSIGPILAVLTLGLLYEPVAAGDSGVVIPVIPHSKALFQQFLIHGVQYVKEVTMALSPIVIFYVIYQHFALKLARQQKVKIAVGVIYTFLGLVIFLTGVSVGFMPAGTYLGELIAVLPYRWILVPLGMIVGYFIVAAEPAVHVLNKQVEEITDGAIADKALQTSLSLGVAVSVGIAMIRVLTGLSIYWFLVPGYAIALILTFFVPKIFTAIAFDSGGVASGPLATTFLLPFAIGASQARGGNVATDAFGIIAMVAMTPLIAIQILGLYYRMKTRREQAQATAALPPEEDIIELEVEEETHV